jgi:hypothetical protein
VPTARSAGTATPSSAKALSVPHAIGHPAEVHAEEAGADRERQKERRDQRQALVHDPALLGGHVAQHRVDVFGDRLAVLERAARPAQQPLPVEHAAGCDDHQSRAGRPQVDGERFL